MTNEEKLENIFMTYLRKIPEDLKPGEKREVSCPCGGTLRISMSKLNNHLHVCCDKCKFNLMQ